MSASAPPKTTARPLGRLRCEIAVVGSGPGGAITARILAEAGRDVVLIEEGPHLSQDSCEPFSRREMTEKYRCRGVTLALGRPSIVYVEGRCVGGGSEINSALYRRVAPELLEQWRRSAGVEALAEEDLRPHFEACEGELGVEKMPGPLPAASLKLRDGAAQVGCASVETPRLMHYHAGRGRRRSMSEVIIPRAVAAGCRVLADTRVHRLRERSGRIALEAKQRNEMGGADLLHLEANHVFVCAGAIQTPALLRRSGIRGQTGNGLRLQSMIKVVACFEDEVNEAGMGVPPDQVSNVSPHFSFGCSISSPAHIAMAMADHPDDAARVTADWKHVAVYYAVIWGGTGSVRPLPFARDPLVRYRLGARNLSDLSDALHKLCTLLLAAGAVEVFPAVRGVGGIRRPEELGRIPRPLPADRASLTSLHLTSSCAMGVDARRASTDSFGRVHGSKRINVADASLLCSAPGVNPQGTIMAIARRNAFHFLAEC